MNGVGTVALNLRSLYRHVPDERPRTVGEQQRAGFTLLREPEPPAGKRAPMHISMDAMVHDPTYANLVAFTVWIIGQKDFESGSSFWRKVAYDHAMALQEELLELRRLKLEGRSPDKPAGYLRALLRNHHQIK